MSGWNSWRKWPWHVGGFWTSEWTSGIKIRFLKNHLKVGSQCHCLALWWIHIAGWIAQWGLTLQVGTQCELTAMWTHLQCKPHIAGEFTLQIDSLTSWIVGSHNLLVIHLAYNHCRLYTIVQIEVEKQVSLNLPQYQMIISTCGFRCFYKISELQTMSFELTCYFDRHIFHVVQLLGSDRLVLFTGPSCLDRNSKGSHLMTKQFLRSMKKQ